MDRGGLFYAKKTTFQDCFLLTDDLLEVRHSDTVK